MPEPTLNTLANIVTAVCAVLLAIHFLQPMAMVGYGDSSMGRKAHICNCIGCCPKCGQCRTAPWHAPTCSRIARLNAERERILAGYLR